MFSRFYFLVLFVFISIATHSESIALAGVNDNILFYADTQTNDARHQGLVNLMLKYKPVAVFHGGDLVDAPTPSQWNKFNSIIDPLINVAPFYPAPGNHEGNQQAYYDNFVLPNNEKWYSVDVNGIHFISLNTGTDYGIRLNKNSEQYNWLLNDLQNANSNSDTKFIVTYFHHPLYTTCPGHKSNAFDLRKDLQPLFKQYKVDIAFNGHLHCYERSLVDGVYHVVSSGGGGDFKSGAQQQNGDNKYSQKMLRAYHFSKINADDKNLHVTAIDINNKVIDSFSIPTKR